MSAFPYGGDEVASIVLDIGSSQTKGGFGGEEVPKAMFPSYVGVIRSEISSVENGGTDKSNGSTINTPTNPATPSSTKQSEPQTSTSTTSQSSSSSSSATKASPTPLQKTPQQQQAKYYVGSQALSFRKDFMEVESPFKDGLVDNWDYIEKLIDYTLSQRLKVQSSDHPILMSEVPYNTNTLREKLINLIFEKFEAPAFFLCKSPVLSCFSNGKSSALVVDVSSDGTCVTPVVDGFAILKGIVRNRYGGDWLSDQIAQHYENIGIQIRPGYMFERKKLASGKYTTKSLDFPNTTKSYNTFCVRNLITDMKESAFRVNEVPFDESGSETIPTVAYELPDGSTMDIGTERFTLPEQLFLPSAIRERNMGGMQLNHFQQQISLKPINPSDQTLVDVKAVHLLANESIMRCDVEIRKDMYASTILTGGTSMFDGFTKRFELELAAKAPPNVKVKTPISAAAFPVERKCSTWIGGSILACTGSFQQLWISKADYEENGAQIIHRKCP